MKEEKTNTKELLLQNGIELFSKNGYDGTTTRMIAEYCCVNVSTIAFHFGSKEGYYNAVMNYAAAIMENYFKPFSTKADQYLSGSTYPEKTWTMIEEFVDLILNVVRDKARYSTLYLLIREQTNPPAGDYPLTRIVCKQSERILTELMQNISTGIDYSTTAIESRLIIGGIISQAEHPMFIRRALKLPDDAELNDKVWNEIKRITIESIYTATQNKSSAPVN